MSHFAVLVITEQQPTEEVLGAVLQPFHEFECTGENDQYVQDVDVTEDCLENGLDWHGLDDKTVTSEDEVDRNGEHKYGFAIVHGDKIIKAVTRTNPNKQWDWWVLGGRYNSRLYAVEGADFYKGRGGLMTPVADEGADAVRRSDLDFSAMQSAKQNERREWADEVRRASGLPDADIEKGINLKAQFHDVWKELPEPRPRGGEYREWLKAQGPDGDLCAVVDAASFSLPPLKPGQTLEEWIASAPAISSWAVLKDGEWTEKGSMGWFGMASDEKDDDEWERTVSKLVEGLPPDHWVSIVDCHI